MNTGETRNAKVGMGAAAALLVVAMGFVGFQVFGGRDHGAGSLPGDAFYTDDNGKTFFKDDVRKIVPFDHKGKQAYRADVFQGSDGKQFVGLIYRHTDSGRKELGTYFANKPSDPEGVGRRLMELRGMQVKPIAAGEKAWVLADDVATERLQGSVTDPSGKPAKLVSPK
jgi:hypothetical protein